MNLSEILLSEMNLNQITGPEKGKRETDMKTEMTLKVEWNSQKLSSQKWTWIKSENLRKEKGKQTWKQASPKGIPLR